MEVQTSTARELVAQVTETESPSTLEAKIKNEHLANLYNVRKRMSKRICGRPRS